MTSKWDCGLHLAFFFVFFLVKRPEINEAKQLVYFYKKTGAQFDQKIIIKIISGMPVLYFMTRQHCMSH